MKHLYNPKASVMNKIIKTISIMMIISGVLLVLYPFLSHYYSIAWQERIRRDYESNQDKMGDQSAETAQGKKLSGETGDIQLMSKETEALSKEPDSSTLESPKNDIGFALLEIPAIDLSVTVVKGTSKYALAKGPGWYEQSALPGKGNTAIAGHRNVGGSWFRNLDRLKEGDLVTLTYKDKKYNYKVEKTFVVSKSDWSIIEPTDEPVLTLMTCHPLGSTEQRIVIRATLVTQ
jgi:sortase A